jgi:hypothetical protein
MSKVRKNNIMNTKRWLQKYGISNFYICDNGVVDVADSVSLRNYKASAEFPIQFGKVTGNFDMGLAYVKTLKGVPTYIGGDFDCSNTGIMSMSGIDKLIRHVSGSFNCASFFNQGDPSFRNTGVTHVLGILLIEGVTHIRVDSSRGSLKGPVDKIMNKYLGTGDIISCQDELIDAGFILQARL